MTIHPPPKGRGILVIFIKTVKIYPNFPKNTESKISTHVNKIIMKVKLRIFYILKTLWHYRSRILLVLFGLIFALGLLFANVMWAQTSEELVIEDFNNNTDYLASTFSFAKHEVFGLMDYLETEPLVGIYDRSIRTNAIFNSINKNGSYRYFPLDNQQNMTDPVDVIPSITTDLHGMKRLKNVLDIIGDIPRSSDEMMISYNSKLELERIYNVTIEPDTVIDVEIGRRFPFTEEGEIFLKNFRRKSFHNITITGLFERNGAPSIADLVYSPNLFENLVIFPMTNNTLNTTDLEMMDNFGLNIIQMIEINRSQMIKAGIDNLDQLLFRFLERVKSRFWFAVGDILEQAINELQINYEFSFHSALLYYPLILLSLLLSHYGIGQLIYQRNTQISVLKIRGANNFDIIKLYALEYLIIAVLGIFFGIPLAILLAGIIPAFQDDFSFNEQIAYEFLMNLDFQGSELLELGILTFTFYFLSVTYQIVQNVYLSEDSDEHEKYFKFAQLIVTIVFTVLLYIYFNALSIPLNPTNIDNNNIQNFRNAILYLTIIWFLYSQYLTDFVLWVLKKGSKISIKFSPKYSFYLIRSLRKKKSKNKILVFYIIFMFSVLVFSSSLYSTYNYHETTSDQFLQGAPLRIHTTGTYSNYTNNLTNTNGIKQATPILSTQVHIASVQYTLYAVDPDTYLDVGYWEHANGSGTSRELLSTIDNNRNNILVPQLVIDELDFSLNKSINVLGIFGSYVSLFNISGILNSAPGLGLAGTPNQEVSQNTRGWLMTSIDFIKENYPISYTKLFLGDIEGGSSVNEVKNDLKGSEKVLEVNPKPINQNFVGSFITTYLPKPKSILVFVSIITALISLIIISISTEYIINERKEELALMVATGASRQFVIRFLIYEFILVITGSIVAGLFYGLVIAQLSLRFFIPFTLRKIFVPISLHVNPLIISILMFGYIFLILGIILFKKDQILPENITDILQESEQI